MQKRMYTYYFVVLAPPAALAYGLLRRPVRLNAFVFGLGPVILAAGMVRRRVCRTSPTDGRGIP